MALRVRPFNEKELKETNQSENLITFVPGQPQQISIDQDRRHFTFDYVYPSHKSQADVYQSCIQPLFDQFVNGLVYWYRYTSLFMHEFNNNNTLYYIVLLLHSIYVNGSYNATILAYG